MRITVYNKPVEPLIINVHVNNIETPLARQPARDGRAREESSGLMRERHHCVDRILLFCALKGGRAQVIHKEYTAVGKLTRVPTCMGGGQLSDSAVMSEDVRRCGERER